NLEAHARTVQGPCRPGLDCLPLPRSTRRRTEGEPQRYVQAWAVHERGCERAPLPSRASSTIARDACRPFTRRRVTNGRPLFLRRLMRAAVSSATTAATCRR